MKVVFNAHLTLTMEAEDAVWDPVKLKNKGIKFIDLPWMTESQLRGL